MDRTSADDVSRAYAVLAYTYDTATDTGPADARRRAAALADPALAAALADESTDAAGGGQQWADWAAHHAYTRVEASPNADGGAPPDTATDAIRSWQLTLHPVGDDGWQGGATTLVIYLALTQHDGSWAVTDLRVGQ